MHDYSRSSFDITFHQMYIANSHPCSKFPHVSLVSVIIVAFNCHYESDRLSKKISECPIKS